MKREQGFGPPQVLTPAATPGLDPRVARYQQGAAQRRTAPPLPKYNEPVAGGPGPTIPHLEAPAQEGLSMADQAMQQRHAAHNVGSIIAPPTVEGILQNDLLPSEARQDPNFRDGPGAMYAANQKELAKKYGVIRNGRQIPAQQLFSPQAQGGGALKSATVEGLEAVAKFNAQRKHVESGDQKIEADSSAGLGGAAAAAGDGPAAPPMDAAEVQRRIESMDDHDFASFRQALLKDLLNNDDQRKLIEERLEPLDLTTLIMAGSVTQTVPIIPGRFEPEFQNLCAEEDLALKRLVMEETKSLGATEQYMLDKFSVMVVACGLRSINKKQLPDHRDTNGSFNDELFRKKFALVIKYPFHMIASLGLNWFWFDVRVRKLFVAEKIKNG